MSDKVNIDKLLEDVVSLPSLPDTVARIDAILNDPNGALADVGRVISADPAIALKTLKLINSAYYGLPNKIASVEHATSLLGAKVIKNLVLTASVFDTLFKGDAMFFMQHSVFVGASVRALVETAPITGVLDTPEDAFIFGLLHDIGKIVLRQLLPAEYGKVQVLAQAKELPWFRAEQEVVVIDHAALGARLAKNWQLPDALVAAIAGHHEPDKAKAPELVKAASLLNIADFVCASCGITSEPSPVMEVAPGVWEKVGLSSANARNAVLRFFAALPATEELLHLSET